MNPQLFEKTSRFYQAFDEHLIRVEGNVCKACRCNECCTFAAKGGKHSVSKLEFDYIEHFYREKGYPQGSVELFKEYLSQKKNKNGEVVHAICPFYSHEEEGCSIYPARPLSCRMYGSFFLEGFPAPPQCYFKSMGKTVRRGAFLDDVPLSLEFFELKAEHLGTRPVRISKQESSPFMERDLDDLPAFDMKSDPYVRACKLEWAGKFEEAIVAYKEAREKYPRWSFIPSCMGTDYIMLRRFPEAVEALRQAVEMRPENAFYHFVLAMALELNGEIEGAAAEYGKAIGLNDENAIAHASLANILHNEGDLKNSLRHYRKALALDPDSVFYHFYTGVVLMKTEELEEAEAELKKALALDPGLALAALHLAKIYNDRNRMDEAREMWQRYLDLSKEQASRMASGFP